MDNKFSSSINNIDESVFEKYYKFEKNLEIKKMRKAQTRNKIFAAAACIAIFACVGVSLFLPASKAHKPEEVPIIPETQTTEETQNSSPTDTTDSNSETEAITTESSVEETAVETLERETEIITTESANATLPENAPGEIMTEAEVTTESIVEETALETLERETEIVTTESANATLPETTPPEIETEGELATEVNTAEDTVAETLPAVDVTTEAEETDADTAEDTVAETLPAVDVTTEAEETDADTAEETQREDEIVPPLETDFEEEVNPDGDIATEAEATTNSDHIEEKTTCKYDDVEDGTIPALDTTDSTNDSFPETERQSTAIPDEIYSEEFSSEIYSEYSTSKEDIPLEESDISSDFLEFITPEFVLDESVEVQVEIKEISADKVVTTWYNNTDEQIFWNYNHYTVEKLENGSWVEVKHGNVNYYEETCTAYPHKSRDVEYSLKEFEFNSEGLYRIRLSYNNKYICATFKTKVIFDSNSFPGVNPAIVEIKNGAGENINTSNFFNYAEVYQYDEERGEKIRVRTEGGGFSLFLDAISYGGFSDKDIPTITYSSLLAINVKIPPGGSVPSSASASATVYIIDAKTHEKTHGAKFDFYSMPAGEYYYVIETVHIRKESKEMKYEVCFEHVFKLILEPIAISDYIVTTGLNGYIRLPISKILVSTDKKGPSYNRFIDLDLLVAADYYLTEGNSDFSKTIELTLDSDYYMCLECKENGKIYRISKTPIMYVR